jgi:hypothetical protein
MTDNVIQLDRARASKRWVATCFYRSGEVGVLAVVHNIDELAEIEDIVERGFNWYALDHVEIKLAVPSDMTIEEASKL